MKAQDIYDLLRAGGLSRAGALGMLGNMQAESGLKEDIAQRGMTLLSDEEYTRQADNGQLNFSRDAVGYGLCQWTYFSRKAALLDKAKACGCSVGNGTMQVEFCLDELIHDYPAVFQLLCSSDSIDECSDTICKDFERPAVNNFLTRRSFAHEFASVVVDGKDEEPPVVFPADPSIICIQAVMQFNGYWEDRIDGQKSRKFFDALRKFTDDMEVC